MAKFWLATFEVDPQASEQTTAELSTAGDHTAWALEIIYQEDLKEYAVLLSRVDDLSEPKKLECSIGFVNGSKACSIWRDRGFPFVDAIIDDGHQGLRVRSACFLEQEAINYDAEIISVSGMMPSAGFESTTPAPCPSYVQWQEAPDHAFPATWIKRRKVTWSPERLKTATVPPAQLSLRVSTPRFPILAPVKSGHITPKAVWHGTMDLPKWPPEFDDVPVERVGRVVEFGAPAFQFDDVEVLCFRLNLDELGIRDDKLLAKLVDRLNFHLEPLDFAQSGNSRVVRNPIPDFRYRPANRTLLLELLRYGKMRTKDASAPLRPADFQSQHELLVRILIGRVDDDTSQARDPATYVPTIFVDNPWSKILGRNAQGFDKWLAEFCILIDGKPKPLRPDGRRSASDERPQELASIREIHLVTNSGSVPSDRLLMQLDCPYNTYENWSSFLKVDLEAALVLPSLAPTRWRQDDFDKVEFRRSFARTAVSKSLMELRSTQVSPVGEKELLEKWKSETTLINGTFNVEGDARIVMPNGNVTLTLCAHPTAPQAWKDVCALLGIAVGEKDSISLGAGNWYRMRCSTELLIHNKF